MKKIIKDLFKCALAVNLVLYFSTLIFYLCFSSGHSGKWLSAIGIAGFLLLLLFSVLCLFTSPRTAAIGFLVLVCEIVFGSLFPEL
jgi:hypothetical protein